MGQKSRKAALNHPAEFGVLPEGREAGGLERGGLEGRAVEGAAHGSAGGASSEDSEKLHRIRDLLFGEEARDQAQRLDSLEITFSAALADAEHRFQDRLESTMAAADAALSELKESFAAEVDRLKGELASTQEELRTAQAAVNTQAQGKVERSDFAAMLGELAKRVEGGDAKDAS